AGQHHGRGPRDRRIRRPSDADDAGDLRHGAGALPDLRREGRERSAVTSPSPSANVVPLFSRWTSPAAFVLAAIGAGVGLGNIWRFPYVTGFHGGGAFVVVYIIACFGIVMPVLVAELMIGRRGGGNPMRSIAALARETGATTAWRYFGAIGMIATF